MPYRIVGSVLTLTLVLLGRLCADDAWLYVSCAKDQQLASYRFDLESGNLTKGDVISVGGAPGAQCLGRNSETLYVSVRSTKSAAAFRIDHTNGKLTHLGTTPLGANAAYLSTDRTGKYLLSASYSDGLVLSHRIRDDRSVGEKISSIVTERCAHSILPDASNRFVLVPHTCPNAVYQFRFDDKTGKLSANLPAKVHPAEGLQPRHLAFHPKLDVVYFDDERGSSVTAYHYDKANGQVKPFQTVSTLPSDFEGGNSCADIEVTRDGKFVYASNRGHNSIAGFAIDAGTGKLKSIGQVSTGDTPRSFNLSPDERWMIVAGQKSNDLSIYRRDPETGSLEKTKVIDTGRNPSWVQFVSKPQAAKEDAKKTSGVSGGTKNWPRFRGVGGRGVSADDPRLPERWSETENLAWKTPIPGWGWSCPVVWGDKVFVTSVESSGKYEKPKAGLYLGRGRKDIPEGEHTWWTYCLSTESGKVLWKRAARRGRPNSARHPKSTYASETPVIDGERLFVLFGDVGLYCYDFDGKLLWDNSIEPKKTFYDYGAAGSPVAHDGQVFMVYDNQESSFIASYDAKTGRERWRTPRKSKSTWATPLVWKNDKRTEIVVSGKEKIVSYDLEGRQLWELSGRMSNLIIPSPLESHGMIYLTSGYVGDRHRPVYAIKPGAKGSITLAEGQTSNDSIAWYQPKSGPYNPSPIVYGDYYYTLLDRGFMTCHDAKTGEVVYGKQRLPPGSSFTSSPWAYNGKIFCLSEDGKTFVVEAGKEFKILHTNELDELSLSTPAACQGKLFLRTASNLYCLTNKAAENRP